MVEFIPEFEIMWDDTIEPREVAPGLAVMREATLKFAEPGVGWIELTVIFNGDLQRLAVDRISISTDDPTSEVTSLNLRAARIGLYLETAGEQMLLVRASDADPWEPAIDSDRTSLLYRNDGDSEIDRVTLAAQFYEYARLLNKPPLKYAADELGVSQSTATRLVAQARLMGIMNERGA